MITAETGSSWWQVTSPRWWRSSRAISCTRGIQDLTVRGFDHAARHLAHWLAEAEIAVADIDEAVVARFARHRCRCPGGRSTKQLSGPYVKRARRFVAFLAERGMVRQKASRAASRARPPRGGVPAVAAERIAASASEPSSCTVYLLMRLLGSPQDPNPRRWDAQHIREVIIAETKRAARGHVKKMASTLRGYVRFLGANGRCRAGLEHAVPIIAQWRLSTLPRYIDAAQVRATHRDVRPDHADRFARPGDPPACSRDWDCGRATSSHCASAISIGSGPPCPSGAKARRETRLPLPQDAGDAVLAYLKRARPRVDSDRVFFMLNAPIRPLVDQRVQSPVSSAAPFARPASRLRRWEPICFGIRPRRPCCAAAPRSTWSVPS